MITLTREEAQQVLDALEKGAWDTLRGRNAAELLRAKLNEPEQEPIAYLCENAVGHKYFRWKKPQSVFKPIALYTAPPQREWVGLTEEETAAAWSQSKGDVLQRLKPFAHAIEQALKEKNT